jgi:hypothetical protein
VHDKVEAEFAAFRTRIIKCSLCNAKTTPTDAAVAFKEENEGGWKHFLGNNTDFILPLDYVRDMAVEQPGESPVLVAKFGSKGKTEKE